VTLEFDLGAKFTDPGDSFNLVAEIPGTDPNAGFVMLGGHFDSWTGGTGATDNAAGAAVAMEAMRILKTVDLKMPRTIRLRLCTDEDEGLPLPAHAFRRSRRHEAQRRRRETFRVFQPG
jgi:acetylornithine deacetylase/succinyl-diaminopimelate desuccinylase-like protein